MSSIVVDEPSANAEPITETQEVVQEAVETQEVQPEMEAETSYEPPEKYAGKTLEDVIEMHQNVEKAFGKQGQEVGQQRKLIEELLESRSQSAEAAVTTEEPVNFEETFYDDPAKAVNSAIENHPDILRAKEERARNAQQANLSQLESTHPDFMDVVENKDFQKWIGSSQIRQELFRKADSEYDFNSANELIGTWKQISMIGETKKVKEAEKVKREKALRQTSSESRSSGDSVGGKKMYRRSDLINLQVTDPNRYADLADEIQLAYAEGRVK